ncbi:MAG: alkaline phosphatase family protein [Actinomycetota bacterium]
MPTRWPIEHVVVIMQENQSFDHLFGCFPGVDGTRFGWDHGVRVPLTHLTAQRIPDLPHCWTCAVASWNGGKMDGFDQSAISRTYAYTQYKRTDEPNYWAWAERYVLDAAVHRGELGAEAAHAARRERAEPPSGLRPLAEAGAPPSPPAPNGLHRPEVADHVVR